MQLNTISEDQRERQLPRVNRDFIGISHELQIKRKARRQLELQERMIQNRVLHLQKEEAKTQRDILQKRKQLQQIITTKQRQEEESREKERLREERRIQLEKLKRNNEYMRMIHKHNLSNTINLIHSRNRGDYQQGRQERIDGQYRKKVEKQNNLNEKREHWFSLNMNRKAGEKRVDEFHKQKNKDHLQEYKSRMKFEESRMESRHSVIKQLEERQNRLKAKLQKSSMKNSKITEIIHKISRASSPLNSGLLETLDGSQTRHKSRKSFQDQKPKKRSKSREDEVEENIEIADDQEPKLMIKVRRKKKNKHVNRYKEYDAF